MLSSQANIRKTFFDHRSPWPPEVGVLRRTDMQTDGHGYSLTNPAESVKKKTFGLNFIFGSPSHPKKIQKYLSSTKKKNWTPPSHFFLFFGPLKKEKIYLKIFLKYQWYYPHRSRDSVSPISCIFYWIYFSSSLWADLVEIQHQGLHW